jgi:hypothetical protein
MHYSRYRPAAECPERRELAGSDWRVAPVKSDLARAYPIDLFAKGLGQCAPSNADARIGCEK